MAKQMRLLSAAQDEPIQIWVAGTEYLTCGNRCDFQSEIMMQAE